MAKENQIIPYRERDHGTFDEEWAPHKNTSGWWYITGYFSDKEHPENLYSFQYTVAQGKIFGITAHILHMAFTDFQNHSHLFKQNVQIRRGKNILANQDEVIYNPFAKLIKEQKQLKLSMTTGDFNLDIIMQKGKGAIWHCDNGVLVMGLPNDPKQRTTYYSYPNMPTEGTIAIRSQSGEPRKMEVVGKSWLDRQWGPFRLLDAASHWEWFSLRFFDNEEIMLFYFPQHPYADGTYINKQAQTTRLQNYECKPKQFVKAGKYQYMFSFGWDLIMPGIKEERYEIRPLMDGQFNIAYFEMMAEILNAKKERVGYCFVEILSGARNKLHFYEHLGSLSKKSS